jgi:hypothetical protein
MQAYPFMDLGKASMGTGRSFGENYLDAGKIEQVLGKEARAHFEQECQNHYAYFYGQSNVPAGYNHPLNDIYLQVMGLYGAPNASTAGSGNGWALLSFSPFVNGTWGWAPGSQGIHLGSGMLSSIASQHGIPSSAVTGRASNLLFNCAVYSLSKLLPNISKQILASELAAYTNEEGTSMLGIQLVALKFGLVLNAARISFGGLKGLHSPAIVHLNLGNGEGHYVAVTRVTGNWVTYIDNGVEKTLSVEDFSKLWTGYILASCPPTGPPQTY